MPARRKKKTLLKARPRSPVVSSTLSLRAFLLPRSLCARPAGAAEGRSRSFPCPPLGGFTGRLQMRTCDRAPVFSCSPGLLTRAFFGRAKDGTLETRHTDSSFGTHCSNVRIYGSGAVERLVECAKIMGKQSETNGRRSHVRNAK